MKEGYVPICFADEVSPPPRETPDLWIIERAGVFVFDDSDDHSADEESVQHRLVNGGAYEFVRLVDHGEATLAMNVDGSWSADPSMPAAADQVWLPGDSVSMSLSVEELVQNGELNPGEYDIEYFTWEQEIWTFDAEAKHFLRGAA